MDRREIIKQIKNIVGGFCYYIWKPNNISTNQEQELQEIQEEEEEEQEEQLSQDVISELNCNHIYFKIFKKIDHNRFIEKWRKVGDLKYVYSTDIIFNNNGLAAYVYVLLKDKDELIQLKELYEYKYLEYKTYLEFVNKKLDDFI